MGTAEAQKSEDRGQKSEEEEAPASVVMADAPVGPSAEEEVALLAQEREMAVASKLAPTEDEEAEGELPALEDLVRRIPAPTRQLLDELFRVKFVTVRRVPKKALK